MMIARAETQKRADSIYQAILTGADFGEMARKFSGDNLSYQLGGVLPEFGIGKYESGFENTAYGSKKGWGHQRSLCLFIRISYY